MTDLTALLVEFASRYIWWQDASSPSNDRIIAQVMNIGTYADIRRLEALCSPAELRGVMLRAQPGWISDKSWHFWRGRLLYDGAGPISESAPRRSFPSRYPLEPSTTPTNRRVLS